MGPARVMSALFSAGLNYYVWRRLVRDTMLPRLTRIPITLVFVIMWALVPLALYYGHANPTYAPTLGWIAFPWLALIGVCTVMLVAVDVSMIARSLWGRIANRKAAEPVLSATEAPAMSRRAALARLTGGTVAVAAVGTVGYGVAEARGNHHIVDVDVVMPKLPKSLDGFTIAQITDLHIGFTIGKEFVDAVVERTNALKPDLIVLTGDIVDGPVESLRDIAARLQHLQAPRGVFAITGNHEYYCGADAWIGELSLFGIRYLRNQRVAMNDASGAGFDLVGIDDLSGYAYFGHGPDLHAALADHDPTRATVLLAHQPRQVHDAARRGVDLQLSGHTHGGQVWPFHYIVMAQQGGLLAGRYQIGPTTLHVSRGTGYWGPPVRVLAPLEITRIRLRSA